MVRQMAEGHTQRANGDAGQRTMLRGKRRTGAVHCDDRSVIRSQKHYWLESLVDGQCAVDGNRRVGRYETSRGARIVDASLQVTLDVDIVQSRSRNNACNQELNRGERLE